jgi:DNA-binding LacI/PurR family transcriptional regulator
VSDDPIDGLGSVAKKLFELGHRRVLPLIEIGPSVRDAEIRIHALRSALEALGVEFLEPTAIEPDTAKLIEDLPAIWSDAKNPTAIFCWRDLLAYRVLEACNELGWDIPSKFSVVGYDGIHWPAATPHEAASVVADIEELALQTFTLINELVDGIVPDQKVLRVRTDFLPGTSLGPAPDFQLQLSSLINLEQQ